MKKFIQLIFRIKTIPVTDAKTGEKQKASYNLLFGFPISIKYQ
ncbi:hypothetical protein NZ698_00350 [Chryseobacterium sp. PBS4-4]|uniref:Uncharacterized protein n=1 Tax=Chryseobacterium edaphi TaxID=2976532 RepID=A0ABT2W0X5_9FLAO|nr:hypothetical protein [Chryseobacterium edaphi]MCU7615630.1 hypothetical protein [Chryseobacterium edaphi]